MGFTGRLDGDRHPYGHSLIADAQQRADNYAADAQCDDRAGGKVVAVHSHISLPRSRSVIV